MNFFSKNRSNSEQGSDKLSGNGAPSDQSTNKDQQESRELTTDQILTGYSFYESTNVAVKALDRFRNQMEGKGRSEGTQGLPHSDIKDFFATEKTLLADHQQVINESAERLGQDNALLKEGIFSLTEEVKIFDHSKTVSDFREETAKEEALDIERVKIKTTGRKEQISEEIRLNQKEIDRREAQYNKEIDGWGGLVPVKKWWRDLIHYYTILIFFGISELPVNVMAALAIGESSNAMGIILALGLSLLVIPGGHFLGTGLQTKDRVRIIGGACIGAMMFVVIVALRSAGGFIIVMALLNIVIFTASTLLAYERAKFRNHFTNKDAMMALSVKNGTLRQLSQDVAADEIEAISGITNAYRNNATKAATEEFKSIKIKLDDRRKRRAALHAYGLNVERQVKSKFLQSLNIYRTKNTESRHRKFPPVQLWETGAVPQLTFYFLGGSPPPTGSPVPSNDGNNDGGGSYAAPYPTNSNSEATVVTPSGVADTADTNDSYSLNGLKNGLGSAAKALIIGSVFTIGLSSCDESLKYEDNPDQVNVLVLADMTDHIKDDVTEIPKYITEDILGIEKGSITTLGVEVTVSTIQETSLQKAHIVSLTIGKGFLSRNDRERKKEVQVFTQDVEDVIGRVVLSDQTRNRSRIYASLCQHLEQLYIPPAEKKVALIFSDMLEHTPEFSFYSYRGKEKQLMKDYDKISKILMENSSPTFSGSLYGVEIFIIHIPNKKDDLLFVEALKFWKKFLSEKGARVIYKPNL